MVSLEADASGAPSGRALATAEIDVVRGAGPWMFVPLGSVPLAAGPHHLVVGVAGSTRASSSRVCFLKHTDRSRNGSQPWSVSWRAGDSWRSRTDTPVWLEPVFLLEFEGGRIWGQPYHSIEEESVSRSGGRSWDFVGTTDLAAESLVTRLVTRGGDDAPRFRLSDGSGAELASGTLEKADEAVPWRSGYVAELVPAVHIVEGQSYRFAIDVGASGSLVHRTPVSDFPGSLAGGAAQDGRGIHRGPSLRLVPGRSAPDDSNLAPNPGFESDPLLDYFTHSEVPAATSFAHARDPVHGGARSLSIVSTQPAGALSRWLSRNERIGAVAGGRYSASVWIRTAEAAGVVLAINFWDAAVWGHLATHTSSAIHGTNGWTLLRVTGAAPAGSAYLRAEVRLSGAGSVWADDIVVQRVDRTPAPAPTPARTPVPVVTPRPSATSTPTRSPTPGATATPAPAPTSAPTPTATPAPVHTGTPPSGSACLGQYYVATHGSDSNAGTSSSAPFRTIGRAAGVAAGGHTVCVAAGTYRERVRITRSGSAGAPVVFQGAPGAIVDGGDDHSQGWINATEFGKNAAGVHPVWKKQIVFPDGTAPYHGTLDGKYILRLREYHYDGTTPFMSNCAESPSSCTGGDRMRNGPRGHNTANASGAIYQSWTTPSVVQAFFGIDNGWTYVAFADGGTANGRNLTFAPRNGGAFQIEASHVVVRGFTIRGANYPVYLPSSGSHHNLVEGNTVRNGFFGVFLAGGAHSNTIRNNDISIDYHYTLKPTDAWHWFTWNAFRNNSELHRASVSMSGAGNGNEVVGNTIHDAFGGIDEDGSTPGGAGVRVHANTIQRCLNDALTITGGADSQWYDNTLEEVNIGARFWPFGNGGSVSFYRNRIFQPDSDRVESCLFFFRGSASDAIRIYHNSCSGNVGMLFGSTNVAPGLPKVRVYNNILSARTMIALNDWSGWSANFGSSRKPDVAYNWLSSGKEGWMAATNVSGNGRMWSPSVLPAWSLLSFASAQAIGIDVSLGNGALGTPWPGFSAGYFEGPAPDAGAVQVD